jgi:HlyD family secretion protein
MNKKKIINRVSWSLVAIIILYTFYFLWKQSQPVPEVYELLTPANRTIERTCVATGQIEPRQKTNLKPRITGTLSQIYVKAGQNVSVGQKIATVSIIPDMVALNNARSAVQSTKLTLDEARRQASTVEALYKKEVVSKEEYEKTNNALMQAEENYQKAVAQLDIVRYGTSRRQGEVNTTEVVSTVNGTIIDIPLKEGSPVVSTSPYNEGTTVAVVADMSDMLFEGKIDETEVEKLYIGMDAKINLGSNKEKLIEGKIEEISTLGVRDNGTIMFKVKARVEKGSINRAGYSANATFVTDRRENVISIEETAVVFEQGKTYVYRLVSNNKVQKFERIPVEIGLSDGIYIEILNGVTADMTIRGNLLN